jgi:hypothetical protein
VSPPPSTSWTRTVILFALAVAAVIFWTSYVQVT